MAYSYGKGYQAAKRLRYALRVASSHFYKATNRGKKFTCPLCNYRGPFKAKAADTGLRQHAQCPRCGSLERHRLQFLVLQKLGGGFNLSTLRVLHVAPEMFVARHLRKMFKSYTSTDLSQKGVDFHADLRSLPIPDGSYDVVYASHVLEHIDRDRDAIAEIRRILSPGGFAILPVPIVGMRTVEYSKPNPFELMHFRAPGLDYFDRYRECFQKVECFTSENFSPGFQLYIYEDRSHWPTERMPLREPSIGEKHEDIVPVCFA